jgi:hypothetical protein
VVDMWWICGEVVVGSNKRFVRLVVIFLAVLVVNFN